MSQYFMKGNLVGLKGITQEHVNERYLSWLNDPEVTRYLETGYFPTSMEELQRYVKGISPHDLFLAIHDLASNLHIGNIKLSKIHPVHRTAELGIMIGDRNFWGKGYGLEAVKLLVQYGFQRLNLRKIYLGVYSNHHAAIKSYQKAGFQIESVLKEHVYFEGEYIDTIYMSIFHPMR